MLLLLLLLLLLVVYRCTMLLLLLRRDICSNPCLRPGPYSLCPFQLNLTVGS